MFHKVDEIILIFDYSNFRNVERKNKTKKTCLIIASRLTKIKSDAWLCATEVKKIFFRSLIKNILLPVSQQLSH